MVAAVGWEELGRERDKEKEWQEGAVALEKAGFDHGHAI